MTLLMSLALDQMLTVSEQHRLQDHLAACSSCQMLWGSMRQVSALFETSSMVGPPLGFAIRVQRRLEEKAKKRHRAFGGMAVLTSSVSLAGLTIAAVVAIALGVLAWQWYVSAPDVQQSVVAVSQVASGMGLVGKGASFFLKDLLLRYGLPLVLLLGLGLLVLTGMWTWLFVKRPGRSRHNGYA